MVVGRHARGASRLCLDPAEAGLVAVAMTLLVGSLTAGSALGWPARMLARGRSY